MSRLAKPVSELVQGHIKLLIYGRNRTGKTTLSCLFPKPLLLISFEPNPSGGALSVTDEKSYPAVTNIKIEDIQTGMELARELRTDPRSNWQFDAKMKKWSKLQDGGGNPLYGGTPFATVVLDTVTSLQDIVLKELMGWAEVPEQMAWGTVPEDVYRQRSEKTRECLRPFFNLSMNTVVNAQEKDHNPPQGERNRVKRGLGTHESFFGASVGGATHEWLNDACDFITRLSIEKEIIQKIETEFQGEKLPEPITTFTETGKMIRRLRTSLHVNFAAGFRSPKYANVPEYIEGATPEEMYSNLMKVIKGTQ